MAATVRICSCVRNLMKATPCFQGVRSQIGTIARVRVFSTSDEIESNPFYDKYAERIKKVRNEIKDGRK